MTFAPNCANAFQLRRQIDDAFPVDESDRRRRGRFLRPRARHPGAPKERDRAFRKLPGACAAAPAPWSEACSARCRLRWGSSIRVTRNADAQRESNGGGSTRVLALPIGAAHRSSLERNLVVVRLRRELLSWGAAPIGCWSAARWNFPHLHRHHRRRHGELPSICMFSPTTLSLLRFCPDCLSSQESS